MTQRATTSLSLHYQVKPSQKEGHLGETLPFLAWRIQHGTDFSPNGRSTKKRLVDYLAENIWVTTSGNFNTQALHCTILTMGADRILFSNDYPYEDYAED